MSEPVLDLFKDFLIAASLLLLGQVLRSKISFLQRLFLPASIIAGFLALILGNQGFGLLPFSDMISKYPGLLVALIFASLPLVAIQKSWKNSGMQISSLAIYSCAMICLQWGCGGILGLILINFFYPDLHQAFGALLPAGFVGGHGTAAAMGSVFIEKGWEDAASLAMTVATVGIVSSVLGGIVFIKWASHRGHTQYLTSFKALDPDLKSGYNSQKEASAIGLETVKTISIDPLAFHLAIVASVAWLAWEVQSFWNQSIPNFKIPLFAMCYLAGLFVSRVFSWSGFNRRVDKQTLGRINGSLTDFLVVYGIASIKISVVVQYAIPLALLVVLGLILGASLMMFLSPRIFKDNWFENALYTWGWTTGVMAMAIVLLRIVDSKNESNLLGHFAMAYLIIGPIEIFLVSAGPGFLLSNPWPFVLTNLLIGIGLCVVCLLFNRKTTS